MDLKQLEIELQRLKSLCDIIYSQVKMINPSTLLEFKGMVLHTLEEIDKDITKLQDEVGKIITEKIQTINDRINEKCEDVNEKSSDRSKLLHTRVDMVIANVAKNKCNIDVIKAKAATYAAIIAFILTFILNLLIPLIIQKIKG